MLTLVREHIERSIQTKRRLMDASAQDIAAAGLALAAVLRDGGKLLCCGNGGSAGDAQHIATELSIRYRAKPERPSLPALSLAADSSAITACGNDFGFDFIFSRQVEGLGRQGDALLGITTSGNSRNVLEALAVARSKGMVNIVFTGGDGGRLLKEKRDLVDHVIVAPTDETARIQECHIMIGQILCAIVERELYGFE